MPHLKSRARRDRPGACTSSPAPPITDAQADRDPRDDEAVPSDEEVEEQSRRGGEGSEDEGEDLMDGMEA